MTGAYDDMEVREYLSFVGEGRHVFASRLRERLRWVLEACGLAGIWPRPIGELSKGYRQRVGLAQALIHDPPVLVLDEPTSGLDPLQIVEIRRLVRGLAKHKAILFSSHILQEIAAVSDRVLVLNEGRLIADGPLAALAGQALGEEAVRVALVEAGEARGELAGLAGVRKVEALSCGDGLGRFRITARQGSDLQAAVSRLARERGWGVHELYKEAVDLEEVFTALIRRHAKPELSEVHG